MKIFNISQTRELDDYTIRHEPVSSINLMERAASKFTEAFRKEISEKHKIFVFAGPGNNGGDALAIARLLLSANYNVKTFLFDPNNKLSPDCEVNKLKLSVVPNNSLTEVKGSFAPPSIEKEDIIIDGLFGSGINKPLEGGYASLVKYLNESKARIYSIDIPSGLFGEDNRNNNPDSIIKAYKTFTFQFPKLSFFFRENSVFTGIWEVLDIGLHPDIIKNTNTAYNYLERKEISLLIPSRNRFAHKGVFGHAFLIAGSKGKMGAAILASKACLRSGAGLLTAHIPACGEIILQTAFPEAMIEIDKAHNHISEISNLSYYDVIAVGPGIGQNSETAALLSKLFHTATQPLILDADALNLMAKNKDLLNALPAGSILTPHPKEFDRLAGNSRNSYERLQKARELASQLKSYIILKGAYTAICTPEKNVYFNSTGNPGMATAGSGDVLTGMLLGLMAQSYSPLHAACTGVYLHGLAGDIGTAEIAEESLIASDIIRYIHSAFRTIREER